MRLKTYTAPSLADAMVRVRAELGEEAIIVSTEDASPGGEVRVVAARDDADPEDAFVDAIIMETPAAPGRGHIVEAVAEGLDRHRVPANLAGRLFAAARGAEAHDSTLALAAALDSQHAFRPLSDTGGDRALMLVGPPGGGKTVTAAKLAARALVAGRTAGLVSTDTVRAGGVEQLSSFAAIMGIGISTAEDGAALGAATRMLADRDLVVIDTTGANHHSGPELDNLQTLAEAAGAEPVLVLPAGLDGEEAAEIARAFARIGATRLVVTRADLARRLGAVLAAADAGRLALAELGSTPELLDGLTPLNPVSLARLLLGAESEQSLVALATGVPS